MAQASNQWEMLERHERLDSLIQARRAALANRLTATVDDPDGGSSADNGGRDVEETDQAAVHSEILFLDRMQQRLIDWKRTAWFDAKEASIDATIHRIMSYQNVTLHLYSEDLIVFSARPRTIERFARAIRDNGSRFKILELKLYPRQLPRPERRWLSTLPLPPPDALISSVSRLVSLIGSLPGIGDVEVTCRQYEQGDCQHRVKVMLAVLCRLLEFYRSEDRKAPSICLDTYFLDLDSLDIFAGFLKHQSGFLEDLTIATNRPEAWRAMLEAISSSTMLHRFVAPNGLEEFPISTITDAEILCRIIAIDSLRQLELIKLTIDDSKAAERIIRSLTTSNIIKVSATEWSLPDGKEVELAEALVNSKIVRLTLDPPEEVACRFLSSLGRGLAESTVTVLKELDMMDGTYMEANALTTFLSSSTNWKIRKVHLDIEWCADSVVHALAKYMTTNQHLQDLCIRSVEDADYYYENGEEKDIACNAYSKLGLSLLKAASDGPGSLETAFFEIPFSYKWDEQLKHNIAYNPNRLKRIYTDRFGAIETFESTNQKESNKVRKVLLAKALRKVDHITRYALLRANFMSCQEYVFGVEKTPPTPSPRARRRKSDWAAEPIVMDASGTQP